MVARRVLQGPTVYAVSPSVSLPVCIGLPRGGHWRWHLLGSAVHPTALVFVVLSVGEVDDSLAECLVGL